jgi:hypothetical protein
MLIDAPLLPGKLRPGALYVSETDGRPSAGLVVAIDSTAKKKGPWQRPPLNS